MPSRWLYVLVPLVARESVTAPSDDLEEVLAALLEVAGGRRLRGLVADAERVRAPGGTLDGSGSVDGR